MQKVFVEAVEHLSARDKERNDESRFINFYDYEVGNGNDVTDAYLETWFKEKDVAKYP